MLSFKKEFWYTPKTIITLIVLLCLLLSLTGTLPRMMEGMTRNMDERAETYLKNTRNKAAGALGIVFIIDAVTSLIEAVDVNTAVVGIGDAGSFLEPIEDMLRYTTRALLAGTLVLEAELLLHQVFSKPLIKPFFILAFSLLLAALLLQRYTTLSRSLYMLSSFTAMLFILLRLAIPIVAVSTENIAAAFLNERFEAALGTIQESTPEEIELQQAIEEEEKAARSTENSPPPPAVSTSEAEGEDEQGFLGRIFKRNSETTAQQNTKDNNEDELLNRAARKKFRKQLLAGGIRKIPENLLVITIVFLLETVVLPIFFLFLFYLALRMLFKALYQNFEAYLAMPVSQAQTGLKKLTQPKKRKKKSTKEKTPSDT